MATREAEERTSQGKKERSHSKENEKNKNRKLLVMSTSIPPLGAEVVQEGPHVWPSLVLKLAEAGRRVLNVVHAEGWRLFQAGEREVGCL